MTGLPQMAVLMIQYICMQSPTLRGVFVLYTDNTTPPPIERCNRKRERREGGKSSPAAIQEMFWTREERTHNNQVIINLFVDLYWWP